MSDRDAWGINMDDVDGIWGDLAYTPADLKRAAKAFVAAGYRAGYLSCQRGTRPSNTTLLERAIEGSAARMRISHPAGFDTHGNPRMNLAVIFTAAGLGESDGDWFDWLTPPTEGSEQ